MRSPVSRPALVAPAVGSLDLIGKRVQIRAMEQCGSSHLLNGLKGTVVGLHPIAAGWVKLRLDQDSITPHQDRSIPKDRLIASDDEAVEVD
jgi:hypothetical protein